MSAFTPDVALLNPTCLPFKDCFKALVAVGSETQRPAAPDVVQAHAPL